MTNPKIQTLRSKATTKVTIKDENLGDVEWILRSIPAYDLLQNYDIFQGLPNEVKMDPDNMNPDDISLIKNKILPMMEVVVPICVVDPPVTVNDTDPRLKNDEAIHLREIGFNTVSRLFAKIMDISGLSAAADEERKKLEGANSQKQ